MHPILQRLRERKLVQWALAYLAGAWRARVSHRRVDATTDYWRSPTLWFVGLISMSAMQSCTQASDGPYVMVRDSVWSATLRHNSAATLYYAEVSRALAAVDSMLAAYATPGSAVTPEELQVWLDRISTVPTAPGGSDRFIDGAILDAIAQDSVQIAARSYFATTVPDLTEAASALAEELQEFQESRVFQYVSEVATGSPSEARIRDDEVAATLTTLRDRLRTQVIVALRVVREGMDLGSRFEDAYSGAS